MICDVFESRRVGGNPKRSRPRTREPFRKRAFAIGVLLAFSACATLRGFSFERPTLELESIEIETLDLHGGQLNLRLDVFNPNSYDLQTTQVEAVLELEDTHFGNAWLNRAVQLPGASHARVEVPAQFSWEGVGAGARALLQSGEVDYELRTRLRLQSTFFDRTVELRGRGTVPLITRSP